ncbi:MAG: hypothetical protein GF346_05795 [Candidatus Eisenbacteria bacterium]|nr:hypothetical protein [Candidatus Latescibacterota bacterium]MBD3301941.1 hypothetical protein [Candidatus Eisenbacteria bacterium]
MTPSGPFLYPNFGAEEGGGAARPYRSLRNLPALWGALFGDAAALLDPREGARPWETLPFEGGEAVFPEWRALEGLVPWYSDAAAGGIAAERALPLAGPAPEAVAAVHDKAFALAFAREHLDPPDPVTRHAAVLAPETAADRARFAAEIQRVVASWPDALAKEIVVKPRFGTSGRGWFRGGGQDAAALRALDPARFAARGGAIVEPWALRRADLSTQLWISRGGEIAVIGTTRQLLSRGGTYRGNAGWITSARGIQSGTVHDRAIREAAVALGRAAAARGFWGACGIDSFVYEVPGDGVRLRPIVEINARFTTGLVALGLLRRWAGPIPTRRGRRWLFLLVRPEREGAGSARDAGWEHRLTLDPYGEGIESLLQLGHDRRPGSDPAVPMPPASEPPTR